jgi:hypothetical protein
VIDKALELERDDRWPSAREMQKAFREARGSLPKIFDADSLTVPASPTAVSSFADTVIAERVAVGRSDAVGSGAELRVIDHNRAPSSRIPQTPTAPVSRVGQPASVVPATPRMHQPTPAFRITPADMRAVHPPSPRAFRAGPPPPSAPAPVHPRGNSPSHESGSMPQVIPPERTGARVLVFLAVALFFFCAAVGAYAIRRLVAPR